MKKLRCFSELGNWYYQEFKASAFDMNEDKDKTIYLLYDENLKEYGPFEFKSEMLELVKKKRGER